MSERNKTIQVRVTSEQHERIKNKAQAKGYTSVSAFILHLALEKDLLFEQQFNEIYRIMTKKSSSLNKKGYTT